MKKGILIFSMLALALALPVAAAQPVPAADNGLNMGASAVDHLYLYEKDPTNWEIVPDGSWGKMTFDTDTFVFNGHNLMKGADYALIYYSDPWPGEGSLLLGTGTANNGGNVNIKGDFDFSMIPSHADANYDDGAKIWLVLADDIASIGFHPFPLGDLEMYQMVGWNPAEYLFEYDLIN